MDMDRRDFLKTAGKAATVGAATLALGGRVLGANDRVRHAIVGLRGRGNDHLRGFSKVPNVEIAAFCDIDDSVLAHRLDEVQKMTDGHIGKIDTAAKAKEKEILEIR